MSGWTAAILAAIAVGPAGAEVEIAGTAARPMAAASASRAPVPSLPASVQAVAYPPRYAAPTGFDAYKAWLMQRARREGIREATIQNVIPSLDLNSRAIALDRSQMPTRASSSTATPAMAPYIREHVTSSLISRGQSRYSSHWGNLSRIYQRFGVDPAVLMAIYGKETSYGAITGGFDLLEVLASLAYEGRRRQMFEDEFIAALKLADTGVPRWRLKGSYAGATGYPQFMPTVVLKLRADGDGDGYADIWNNEADALASIANYLRSAGWKPGTPWGVAVRTPPTLNRQAISSDLVAPRCPRVFDRHSRWLTMREWRALGVVPYGQPLPETEMATLLEPDGPGRTAYLLTTNYRAILDYNCSNFYAMTVGLLANAIARR